jgi:hypothetical protein
MGRFDVGDDQPALGRARGGGRESGAEGDRGRGAGWRELDDAKAVQGGRIVVEAPAQALVELLGPVDVGHRDDLDLKFHVDLPGGRMAGSGYVIRWRSWLPPWLLSSHDLFFQDLTWSPVRSACLPGAASARGQILIALLIAAGLTVPESGNSERTAKVGCTGHRLEPDAAPTA